MKEDESGLKWRLEEGGLRRRCGHGSSNLVLSEHYQSRAHLSKAEQMEAEQSRVRDVPRRVGLGLSVLHITTNTGLAGV